MTTLENTEKLAQTATDKHRLAANHADQQADAAAQLRHRQAEAQRALVALDRNDLDEARDQIGSIVNGCPSAETIEQWAKECHDLNREASSALGELQEALAKLREVESTRVRHGGEAIE